MTRKEKMEQLQTAMKAYSDKLSRLHARYAKLHEEDLTERIDALGEITPEKLLTEDHNLFDGSQYALKNVDEFMKKYKYVQRGGFYPATGKCALKVAFRQTDPIEPQIKELMEFIPHVGYIDVKTKYPTKTLNVRYVDIFEHTLSYNGIYTLGVDKKDYAYLFFTRHSTTEVLMEGSLNSILNYIYLNHPYEKRTGSDGDHYDD